jgi:hypothetical protein
MEDLVLMVPQNIQNLKTKMPSVSSVKQASMPNVLPKTTLTRHVTVRFVLYDSLVV